LIVVRPKKVTLIAAILAIATAIAVVVGTSLLFPNALLDRVWEFNQPLASAFKPWSKPMSVFLFLVAVGTSCAAAGLWKGRPWAWWFAVALFSVDACGDAIRGFVTGEIWKSATGAGVSLGFLYLLCRSDVRRYVSSDRTRR
jgi:hypothetical protein